MFMMIKKLHALPIKTIIVIVFMTIRYSSAQNTDLLIVNQKLDSIEKQLTSNELQIRKLQDLNNGLNGLKGSLIKQRNELLLKSESGSIYVCILGTCIYDNPNGGKIIKCISRGDKVKVSEAWGDYYKVIFDGEKGWISKAALQNESEIIQKNILREEKARLYKEKQDSIERERILIEKQQQKEYEIKQQQIERQRKSENEKRKVELIRKYGNTNGLRIFEGKIWIGMTKSMLLESWGRPNDINRTVGAWGVHEQWVFGDTYVYLENDIVTSWQD